MRKINFIKNSEHLDVKVIRHYATFKARLWTHLICIIIYARIRYYFVNINVEQILAVTKLRVDKENEPIKARV